MDKYKLLAIIGKSGSGKDSIFNTLTTNPQYMPKQFNRITGVTTRPPREGERYGKDYYFVSDNDFFVMDQNKELFGISCFNNWYYGTKISDLKPNIVNIGIFDPDRINNITEDNLPNLEIEIICIDVSDKERLLRQLKRVEHPDVDEIVRRYSAEKSEWQRANFKYWNILNETATDYHDCLITLQHFVDDWGQR